MYAVAAHDWLSAVAIANGRARDTGRRHSVRWSDRALCWLIRDEVAEGGDRIRQAHNKIFEVEKALSKFRVAQGLDSHGGTL